MKKIKILYKCRGYFKGTPLIVLVFLSVLLFLAGCNTISGSSVKSGAVKVELYVMSQCPYGVQAESFIFPVLKQFGKDIDFSLNFIAADLGNGNFNSLHGQNEVKGDIVQLCAMKYEPERYADFILCMNNDASNIPNNWEKCSINLGLKTELIRTCYEGGEGKKLLSESIKKSNAASAQASPTIIINGKEYQGQREPLSFARAICEYSSSPVCNNIPRCIYDSDCGIKEGKVPLCKNPGTKESYCDYKEDEKVQLIVINDKRCSDCETSQILDALKNIFLNLDVKEVDALSNEGEKLVKEMGIKVAPSFIFTDSITNTYAWKNNQRLSTIFEQKNGKYKLLDAITGASFYIDEKEREEFLKSIGVILKDNKPQIDFFVMSYCPYGNVAEESIEKVYDIIKEKAEFKPHYVIYSNYGGADYCLDEKQQYCSMHGIVELHQDIREMCVNKYYGIKSWFEFARKMNSKCNYKNADSCWVDVAKEIGLDVEKISACEENDALDLLKEEKRLNEALNIRGSPQIFIDGKEYSGARDADSIKNALCNAYENRPQECGVYINDSASSQLTQGGGCG
ncbi:MAG: thioredoxin domain-containing protein [Candidatus Woesearchaeota archaeon]